MNNLCISESLPSKFTKLGLVHVDSIVQLEMELFPDECFGKLQVCSELCAGDGLGLVYKDQLVAYTLLRKCGLLTDITRLGVRKRYQEKGIGRELLKEVINDSTQYCMLCVRKTNKKAIKLYHQEGFQIIGTVMSSWLMLR